MDMLDMNTIRRKRVLLQMTADKKGIELSIDQLIQLDDDRRRLLQQVEQLRHERNRLSEDIGRLMREGERTQAEQLRLRVWEINQSLEKDESRLEETTRQWRRLMLLVPNPVSPDTPDGESDVDNVEIRRVGEVPIFDFEPSDHVQLGEQLGILDIPRGVKLGGTRNYILKGMGWHLHQAVQQLAMDVLEERGFTPMDVPLLVRGEMLVNTGFFPLGEEETFAINGEDKYAIGTSEVSLVSYYSNEIVDVSEPIRLAAATPCFRKEVGSAGRDVHGLYRVHQFSKVEQVVICEADLAVSERLLMEITANAEHILQLLELPYRVVAVCIGDMGQKAYKQLDIETWMPSRNAYGETHSSSNLLDFQARRANIRYRDAEGKIRYCYTLNNTAIASPRILIPLLENHQQADGSIYIPKALRPYLKGMDRLAVPG